MKNAHSALSVRFFGGLEGDRTLDLTDANRTLSQTELRAQKLLAYYIAVCGVCQAGTEKSGHVVSAFCQFFFVKCAYALSTR